MDDSHLNTHVLNTLIAQLDEILSGSVGLTECLGQIVRWRFSNLGVPEQLFDLLVGVESELDRFPVGPVRASWDPADLAVIDVEREVAENFYRAEVLEEAKLLRDAVVKNLPQSFFSQFDTSPADSTE